jgi:hypothetical protein
LRWGWSYLAHVDGTLDAAAVFAAEPVATYVATLNGPAGTKAAISSHLRRLHPLVGFAGTTRTPAGQPAGGGTNPGAVGAGVVRIVEPAPLPDTVTAALDAWQPERIADARFDHVAACARAAVDAARPQTPARATDLLRAATYLAAWSHARHTAVRVDAIFTAANIEAFLHVLDGAGVPVSSQRTHASHLHHLRAGLGFPLDVPRRPYPKPAALEPYTPDEVHAFFDTVEQLRHPGRRRHTRAALVALFGAGAHPSDIAHVTLDDLDTAEHRVRYRDRTAPVLAPYRDAMCAAVEAGRTAGDRYLLGGTGTRRANRLRQLLDRGAPKLGVHPHRARWTWLVDAATTPGLFPTPVAFHHAAGGCDLLRITRLADARTEVAGRGDGVLDAVLEEPDAGELEGRVA